jgi:hypothetical protein
MNVVHPLHSRGTRSALKVEENRVLWSGTPSGRLEKILSPWRSSRSRATRRLQQGSQSYCIHKFHHSSQRGEEMDSRRQADIQSSRFDFGGLALVRKVARQTMLKRMQAAKHFAQRISIHSAFWKLAAASLESEHFVDLSCTQTSLRFLEM